MPARARGLYKHPDLLPLFAGQGLAMRRARKLYAAYPRVWDPELFQRWRKAERELFKPAEAFGS